MKNSKRKVVHVEVLAGQSISVVRTNDKGKRIPKPSVLLQRSLDLLDRGRRWIKGAFDADAGQDVSYYVGKKRIERVLTKESYCMLGACREVNTLNERAAERILELALPKGYTEVPSFNDAHATTYADVSRVFRKAIKIAKAAHA